MVASMNIHVAFNHLPHMATQVRIAGEGVPQKVAEAIAETARDLVPVDTGSLLESIETHRAHRGGWVVTADADHAIYVEFGTKEHGAAQPFMRPAAHQHEPDMTTLFRDQINGAA
jgi:HK97 gp10 family phage protein